MYYLLFLTPVLVVLMEHVAISSAMAYARYLVDYDRPVIPLMGGIVRVGGNLPYDAIPNTVVVLHLLALLFSVIYLIYFFVLNPFAEKDSESLPLQEG